jgi:hypothetical protein
MPFFAPSGDENKALRGTSRWGDLTVSNELADVVASDSVTTYLMGLMGGRFQDAVPVPRGLFAFVGVPLL